MARSNINTGITGNDGRGDDLRTAATKVNDTFTELYQNIGGDSDILPLVTTIHNNTTIGADGTLDSNVSYYIFTSDSDINLVLPDGSATGQYKLFTNRGLGSALITPNNWAHDDEGALVQLAENGSMRMVWDGTQWLIVGNASDITIT